MRSRLNDLRLEFSEALTALRPDIDSSWLTHQRGMFSLLGISTERVDRLRDQQHIYMVRDSRINVAGLSASNISQVAEAIAPLLS
jgi:aspartate/tyrosine/aromatic aminotransferase